jgi:zinc protease
LPGWAAGCSRSCAAAVRWRTRCRPYRFRAGWAGAFVAYIGTSPEREEEARTALLAELRRAAEEPLDEAELERARRYMIGSWQIRQQTHARQLADLAYALMLGEGLVELREFEARIRAVDADAVRRPRRWLREEHVVEAIVRGSVVGR